MTEKSTTTFADIQALTLLKDLARQYSGIEQSEQAQFQQLFSQVHEEVIRGLSVSRQQLDPIVGVPVSPSSGMSRMEPDTRTQWMELAFIFAVAETIGDSRTVQRVCEQAARDLLYIYQALGLPVQAITDAYAEASHRLAVSG